MYRVPSWKRELRRRLDALRRRLEAKAAVAVKGGGLSAATRQPASAGR